MSFPGTFEGFLTVAFLGAFVVFILENWQWFAGLPPDVKAKWVTAIELVLGFAIGAIHAFINQDAIAEIGTWYAAVVPILNLLFSMGGTRLAGETTYALGKRYLPGYFTSGEVKTTKIALAKKRRGEIARQKKAA